MSSRRVSRELLLLVCAGVSIMSLIVSNIITNKQVEVPVIGWAITCGSVCVPLSYIVDDLLTEVYGFRTARTVIYAGFAMNFIAVLYFQLAILAPGIESFVAQDAFETVLGATARTTTASFLAYLVGSLANAKIMDVMHRSDGESNLFLRCISSTVAGEFLDMAVFAVLAFAGVLPWETIGQMVVTNTCAKVAVEAVFYPVVTRHAIRWAKSLE